MDRNMKAEIESLRNEVLTNLKNIESLVGQIDTKLADDETTSCLSRCPEIAKLLELCQNIPLHPDIAETVKTQFQTHINKVHEQLSSIAVNQYTQNMTKVLHVVTAMDEKLGKLSGESPMEQYWENKFPGVRETVDQFLQANGAVKPKVDDVDDEEVKRIIELAKYSEAQPEPEPTNEGAPAWAKDVENKSSRQILQEAAEWDEDAHAIFCRMWNSTAARRVEIMKEVLAETVKHVQTYNYYNEHITVKNRDDVSKLLSKYDSLEAAKTKVIDILENFDRATLDSIASDKENDQNWKIFYDWNKRLIAELESVATEMPQGMQVASSCHTMLRVMSKDKEAEVFDPMTMDLQTFQLVPMKMPPDKLIAYRQVAYDNYMRDLQRAYEWIGKVTAE